MKCYEMPSQILFSDIVLAEDSATWTLACLVEDEDLEIDLTGTKSSS